MRQPTFVIETRQSGEPWHVAWRGTAEAIALQAARGLRTGTYEPPGSGISIPRYPWVRVRRGKVVIWSCSPGERTTP